MPLRDHFHPPVDDEVPWEALPGQWPAEIVTRLNRILPRNYQALPRIHWGPSVKIEYEIQVVDLRRRRRQVNGLTGPSIIIAQGAAALTHEFRRQTQWNLPPPGIC